jgi:hypothetical protein
VTTIRLALTDLPDGNVRTSWTTDSTDDADAFNARIDRGKRPASNAISLAAKAHEAIEEATNDIAILTPERTQAPTFMPSHQPENKEGTEDTRSRRQRHCDDIGAKADAWIEQKEREREGRAAIGFLRSPSFWLYTAGVASGSVVANLLRALL